MESSYLYYEKFISLLWEVHISIMGSSYLMESSYLYYGKYILKRKKSPKEDYEIRKLVSVVSWNQRRPTQFPFLLYTRYLSCIYNYKKQ